MLRKATVFIILLLVFVNFDCVACENQDDVINLIAPFTVNDESGKVSRGDCAAAVMKLVGVDNDSAYIARTSFYYQPVFDDVDSSNENAGYIFIAKYSDVAVGTSSVSNNFTPYRCVTIQECLTFMLRCLNDSEDVVWDNVMEDSVRSGLLQKDELSIFKPDEPLLNKNLCVLLSRMLNMDRYLHWSAEPNNGHNKAMQNDMSKSIKYIDQFNKKLLIMK